MCGADCCSRAGAGFGDAVSYSYMGECVGFRTRFARWKKWKIEYARRGYHTFSLEEFVDYGGYGMPLEGVGEKRVEGEAILHAEVYLENIRANPKSS